ncbi:MAG: NADPH-protochlorophyllide oxidoreductase [Synechococcus sp. NP17]|nr:NADPH-protochlorophyllide oxidoreductase [Synechococcus sp. NP17]|tara:strand:+ start:4039 stop:5043 length:1005 start_codon:yes stop_codon:yes gene_type:complete
MQNNDARRILITGGSSGIGLEACKSLAKDGHSLTLLCRTKERCDQTKDILIGLSGNSKKIQVLITDHKDLDNVENGCKQLIEENEYFDTIVLNAGIQNVGIRQPRFTKQGIEETFCVNHLAHQLIIMRLLPLLQKSNRPRLVITSSEVHNPSSGGGRVGRPAALGNLEGLRRSSSFNMINDQDPFDADKAYKDSKLCNILMAQKVASKLKKIEQEFPVIAWSPGLVIPRSSGGFFRTSRKQNPLGLSLFSFVARDLLRITESLPKAGSLLAELINGAQYEQKGFFYVSNQLIRPGLHQFQQTNVSHDAADDEISNDLWELSEALINQVLSTQSI